MDKVILVVRIIMMVLEGISAKNAIEKVAEEHGENASKLWDALPKKYK